MEIEHHHETPSSKSKMSRSCPVCQTPAAEAKLFLDRNIDPNKLNDFSFASRKTPEYMCHKLVKCPICDLVYASEPPSEAELVHAYHVADYDSSDEAVDAAEAYIRAIQPTLAHIPQKRSALEIGTGTGIFLDYLAQAGFSELIGVEPSKAAIQSAPVERQKWIREGIFREEDFTPESFDLICCFMTMEHVPDPTVIARSALRLLRPGGAFVTVTHDYRGFVNRLMGKRSPIIDIEHLQLFSQKSLERLFTSSGFHHFETKPFVNTYSLKYWMRLAPLPVGLKSATASLLSSSGLERAKIGINVGNLISSGYRTV